MLTWLALAHTKACSSAVADKTAAIRLGGGKLRSIKDVLQFLENLQYSNSI
jgi:hypothetical protein